mmetsp:Transcript_18616/g.40315  ORF Transcript_18616/g.40315 Transcript_18616/m.40315 type:complete len:257 (+) Transcript_18616:356-1126(+)
MSIKGHPSLVPIMAKHGTNMVDIVKEHNLLCCVTNPYITSTTLYHQQEFTGTGAVYAKLGADDELDKVGSTIAAEIMKCTNHRYVDEALRPSCPTSLPFAALIAAYGIELVMSGLHMEKNGKRIAVAIGRDILTSSDVMACKMNALAKHPEDLDYPIGDMARKQWRCVMRNRCKGGSAASSKKKRNTSAKKCSRPVDSDITINKVTPNMKRGKGYSAPTKGKEGERYVKAVLLKNYTVGKPLIQYNNKVVFEVSKK